MSILKRGDKGLEVRNLQQLLLAQGAKIAADGDFGAGTEAAVRAFQSKIGLVADGIAGAKTQAALAGSNLERLLRQSSLKAAATRLGVPLAAIMAINQVESRGTGFTDNGRPVVLFERHVMRERLLAHGLTAQAVQALEDQSPGLVNHKPGGYVGGTAEYQRLLYAKTLHEVAALESASWGLFQIMGYHWERLGYASADEFAERMGRNEVEHLEAFVRFIEADSALHKALKTRSWKTFAKLYNGPGYEKNLYDVKLSRAYAEFAKDEAA